MNPAEVRFDIAIIGMSGRFPGAKNLNEFWSNLAQGVESIRAFTEDELVGRGVDLESIHASNYVRAGSVLADSDRFAASFFGYSPREAELMDPQHRLFLECSWEALEDAGYAPRHVKANTGVYAGVSLSAYMIFNLAGNPGVDPVEETFQVMVGGDKDFLCTRLSYKLNLKGPSLTVQSGCSTSLVALHLAVQSLLTYQCDMALTGGVSVGVPQRTGYYYQPGGITSPDGHCRPFDAAAQGTVFGEGVGVLVLKRLEEAVADGDHIYAVIRGSAINNDGSSKIGYTAPSVEGQANVISRAQAIAGVTAETISYIEAHGTGTALGDPVEVTALQQAFGQSNVKARPCAIGSLKSNLGHLDAAAGIAGLMKTALMLKNRQLVPTLHFEQLNPKIDLNNIPFYVNTQHRAWPADCVPLRAGVSSFGIGGTNAHVILEEAPAVRPSGPSRPLQLLSLSAETEAALAHATEDLARHLEQNPAVNLADVAYTLHTGREQFKFRRGLVCSDVADATSALRELPHDRVLNGRRETLSREAVFLLPGGGTQYAGMGEALYRHEPAFRQEMDTCAELLTTHLGYDLRSLLYPSEKDLELCRQKLLRPSVGLPAIFATEYAIARLFLSWGVRPSCMIGHSLGEYAAACLAGVFTLGDALRLVAFRGRMFESLPGGSMLSVNLPEHLLYGLAEGISVAAINSSDQCVLSGPAHAIEEMMESFAARRVECHRLHIEAAAHCSMVEPVMEQFLTFLGTISFSRPGIPFVSNLTGKWITDQEATDPHYWVSHLRHTVRFAEGLLALTKDRDCILLETGPGRTLSTFARQALKDKPAVSSMRHPLDTASELLTTYNALAKLWNVGTEVDWEKVYQFETRHRLSLPCYPFERESYWVKPLSADAALARKGRPSSGNCFYEHNWKRAQLPAATTPNPEAMWIVLGGDSGIAEECIRTLNGLGNKTVAVTLAAEFAARGHCEYSVNCAVEEDFHRLIRGLSISTNVVNVLHLWSLTSDAPIGTARHVFHRAQEQGFNSLLYLTRALAQAAVPVLWRLFVVANGVVQVSGSDVLLPEKNGLLAACTVIPQEYSYVRCSLIDVTLREPYPATRRRLVSQIIAESEAGLDIPPVVAYRGLHRWIRGFEPVVVKNCRAASATVARKVYLITGGLGNLGLVVARHMAVNTPCRIVLTTRSAFPEGKDWERLSTYSEETSGRIELLKKIEETGTEILVRTVDVADAFEMQALVHEIESNWGAVHGVIHLAGITGDKALRLVADLSEADCQSQFRPKVDGCYVLNDIFRNRSLEFCVLFSSTASLLGGPGMLAYAAACCFMDSFAASRQLDGQRWISINWDGWVEQGSAHFLADHSSTLDRYALPHSEALRILDTILASDLGGQIIISSGNLASRVAEWTTGGKAQASRPAASPHLRPTLSSEFAPATLPLQMQLSAIWSEILGVEQIGIYDNLFELGGNSLIGLRMVARIKKDLGIDIPVTALFEGPTIFSLSRLMENKGFIASEAYTESRHRGELRRMRRKTLGPGEAIAGPASNR